MTDLARALLCAAACALGWAAAFGLRAYARKRWPDA